MPNGDTFKAMSTRARASLPGGPYTRAVAPILNAAFKESKLTQTALGAVIGQGQSQMSKYLLGVHALNLDEFAAICETLGLDPADVLREAQNP